MARIGDVSLDSAEEEPVEIGVPDIAEVMAFFFLAISRCVDMPTFGASDLTGGVDNDGIVDTEAPTLLDASSIDAIASCVDSFHSGRALAYYRIMTSSRRLRDVSPVELPVPFESPDLG